MKNIITFMGLFFLAALFSCTSSTNDSRENEEKNATEMEAPISEEEKAIEQTIKNVYSVLSFENGAAPNYEAVLSHFLPEATSQMPVILNRLLT